SPSAARAPRSSPRVRSVCSLTAPAFSTAARRPAGPARHRSQSKANGPWRNNGRSGEPEPDAHEVAQAVDAHVPLRARPHDVAPLEVAGRGQVALAPFPLRGPHLVVLGGHDGVRQAL